MRISRGWEKRVIRTKITYEKRTVRIFIVSPQVSLSVFSLVPDLLFDCSRVLEYAKIRAVLQSMGSALEACILLVVTKTLSKSLLQGHSL